MKVLIVDDEKFGRDSLKTLLTVFEFEVETAANGPEAVDVALSFEPDFAVIDFMLGHPLNGVGVADALLNLQPQVRIVIISGQSDVISNAPEDNPYNFLTKPFQITELIALLVKTPEKWT